MNDNVKTQRTARRAATTSALFLAAILASASPWMSASTAYARPTASASGRVFAVDNRECGIRNFREIEPGLARGGRLDDQGVAYLHSKGYKTVVAFWTSEGEKERLAKAGIELVSIPIKSNAFRSDTPTKEQVEKFLAVTNDPAKRPLYFHCKAGRDRTGAMAAIYRMERNGWKVADATEEMKALGFRGHYRALFNFVNGYQVAGSPSAGSAGTEAMVGTMMPPHAAKDAAKDGAKDAASTPSALAAPSGAEARR